MTTSNYSLSIGTCHQLQVRRIRIRDSKFIYRKSKRSSDADLPIEDAADISEDFWKLPDEIRFCSGENECWIDDSDDGLFDLDENNSVPKVINDLKPYGIIDQISTHIF